MFAGAMGLRRIWCPAGCQTFETVCKMFPQSVRRYRLTAYYVPRAVPGIGETGWMRQMSVFLGFTCYLEDTGNTQIKC